MAGSGTESVPAARGCWGSGEAFGAGEGGEGGRGGLDMRSHIERPRKHQSWSQREAKLA